MYTVAMEGTPCTEAGLGPSCGALLGTLLDERRPSVGKQLVEPSMRPGVETGEDVRDVASGAHRQMPLPGWIRPALLFPAPKPTTPALASGPHARGGSWGIPRRYRVSFGTCSLLAKPASQADLAKTLVICNRLAQQISFCKHFVSRALGIGYAEATCHPPPKADARPAR